VVPGIAAFIMYQNGAFQAEMVDATGVVKPDHAYPTLLNLLPSGFKGLAFAALTAAVVASLAGKANSIATIFSLDVFKKFINRDANERTLVLTGRWAVIVAMLLASLVAPALTQLDQAYQFIQEYVGFISPGVLAIFLLGFLWRRTTSAAALTATVLTIPFSTILKFLPQWTGGAFPDYPFLDRMTIVFCALITLMIGISLFAPNSKDKSRILIIDQRLFRPSSAFVVGSVIVLGILTALYTAFW
jgi:SSS family solute:Na+ symporter